MSSGNSAPKVKIVGQAMIKNVICFFLFNKNVELLYTYMSLYIIYIPIGTW